MLLSLLGIISIGGVNKDFVKIALIEVPPYGRSVLENNTNYSVGKLLDIKEWFISTPAVILLENGIVRNSWEEKTPDIDAILKSFSKLNKSFTSRILHRKEVFPMGK